MYLSLALKAAWPWFTSGWPWPAKQSISTIHCHRSLRSSLYSSFLICVFFTVPQNLKPEGFLESSNLSFPNSTWFLLSKFSNFCWIKWIWLLGVYEVRVKEVVLWTEGVKTQLCYRFVPSQHQFQLSLWDSHCLTGWETRCVIPVSGRCLPASGPVPVRLARCHQTNCLMSVLPVFSIQSANSLHHPVDIECSPDLLPPPLQISFGIDWVAKVRRGWREKQEQSWVCGHKIT